MPAETHSTADPETLSFEDALERLQQVVAAIESGDLTLDQTIEAFRQGSVLAARCQHLISEAQLRLTELTPVAAVVETSDEAGDEDEDDETPAFLTQVRF